MLPTPTCMIHASGTLQIEQPAFAHTLNSRQSSRLLSFATPHCSNSRRLVTAFFGLLASTPLYLSVFYRPYCHCFQRPCGLCPIGPFSPQVLGCCSWRLDVVLQLTERFSTLLSEQRW
jgi:hypothetical protein